MYGMSYNGSSQVVPVPVRVIAGQAEQAGRLRR
jgi:hypothetical protein